MSLIDIELIECNIFFLAWFIDDLFIMRNQQLFLRESFLLYFPFLYIS